VGTFQFPPIKAGLMPQAMVGEIDPCARCVNDNSGPKLQLFRRIAHCAVTNSFSLWRSWRLTYSVLVPSGNDASASWINSSTPLRISDSCVVVKLRYQITPGFRAGRSAKIVRRKRNLVPGRGRLLSCKQIVQRKAGFY